MLIFFILFENGNLLKKNNGMKKSTSLFSFIDQKKNRCNKFRFMHNNALILDDSRHASSQRYMPFSICICLIELRLELQLINCSINCAFFYLIGKQHEHCVTQSHCKLLRISSYLLHACALNVGMLQKYCYTLQYIQLLCSYLQTTVLHENQCCMDLSRLLAYMYGLEFLIVPSIVVWTCSNAFFVELFCAYTYIYFCHMCTQNLDTLLKVSKTNTLIKESVLFQTQDAPSIFGTFPTLGFESNSGPPTFFVLHDIMHCSRLLMIMNSFIYRAKTNV